MTLDELQTAVSKVKAATDKPFGINIRADAGDAIDRVDLLIREGVKVASFALAPKPDLIAKLKEAGVVVIPSVGAAKHAKKVAGWGADAVIVQGGEGGGHTGRWRPRCCCRRCSTRSTFRSSPRAASSTAAGWRRRCPTAPRAWRWARASC
jgi:NAD(P)H-dependent flavin oxidoreductase YrpB (nitropropane dioxygenase family)